MSDNNIVLPEELKDKPWVKSILDESGNVDPAKVFSKLDGQESLLGKRHLPGKDSTDEDWKKFASEMTKDYADQDYENALDGLETKKEMIETLKSQGLTPKQAKKIAEAAIKERDTVVAKKYDENTFKEKVRESLTEEEFKKAEKVLKKVNLWDKTVAASNDEALGNIIVAGKLGVAYDVDDVPDIDGGNGSQTTGNGKGYCQGYVDRIYELEAAGKSHAEALAQAKIEYDVKD